MWKKLEFFLLIIIIGMKGFVQGSCLEYGHSCWGAHGKRSDKTTPSAASLENKLYSQNSKDLESGTSLSQRYILLNILVNKNSLDDIAGNLKNSDQPIRMTVNEIDHHKLPDSNRNWNYNKFEAPIRKRIYLRTEQSDNEQMDPRKSRIPQIKIQSTDTKFDPLNFLQKSSKPSTFDKSHYLQPDMYSDEDQSLQDFGLK